MTRLTQPPYGEARAGRTLLVRRQIEEKASSAGWTPKDISSSRYVYHIRIFDDAAGTMISDTTITKSSTESDEGWLDGYVSCGATEYPRARWQLLEIDTQTADTSANASPSGQATVVLEEWFDPIRPALAAS